VEPVPRHQCLLAGQIRLDPIRAATRFRATTPAEFTSATSFTSFRALPHDRDEGGMTIADLGGELAVGRAGGQGQLGRDQLGQPSPADFPPGCVLADLNLPGRPGADPGGRAAQLRPQHDRRPGQPDDQVPVVLPGLVLRRRHLADQAVQQCVGG